MAISMEEYKAYKEQAIKVRDREVRAIENWAKDYIPYYEGETEILRKQYLTEVHNAFNKAMDMLQAMLLGRDKI